MFKPLFAFVGYRYCRIKRKDHFISFISTTSMVGIALGVMVLITVLSVMNGFSHEIRSKILASAPHIVLGARSGNGLTNWGPLLSYVKTHPKVVGAAPFVMEQGMLTHGGNVRGVAVVGITPKETNNVFPLANNIIAGNMNDLDNSRYGVLIGVELARALGVWLNDKITLLAPEANVSPAGVSPRIKRFTIVGIYNTGSYFDDKNIFIHLQDAGVLYRLGDAITGIQMKVADELTAPRVAKEISAHYGERYRLVDWTQEYTDFFNAIKMEKTVMWCILLLIIAVAGFNLVSSLVMMVTDKRQDVAILRTMGVSRRAVMGIFMVQGSIIGTFGTLLGLGSGLLLAANVTKIVDSIQRLFQVQFISPDVYFIGFVPSEIHAMDVVVVCVFSLLMSFVATVYPAFKAASIKPAEALRYE
jgi:lipoprotein-releasing system permease protein